MPSIQTITVDSVQYDINAANGVIPGGTTGQVLAKKSNTDNDLEWVNQSGGGGGAVDSVNGKTGTVVLDADDVGALPDTTTYVASFNGNTGAVTYTAPVTSVNTQTGAVVLSIPSTAADVGAIAAPNSPTNGDFLVYSNGAWVAQSASTGGGASQWTSLVSPTPVTGTRSFSQSFGTYKELLCVLNISATDESTNISLQMGYGTK